MAQCDGFVFLLDNAGEIVFDKILIEELIAYANVTAVVKAGPIINGALLEDAEQVGLDGICEVIDNGGAFVGSHLELVSAGIEPVGHSLCSAPCRAHQRNRLPFAREAESFSQFVLRSRNAASDAAYDQTQQAQTNQ